MRTWTVCAFVGMVCLSVSLSAAQEKDATALDDISRQASQLEADLGKVRDTSPEAAELMLKLIEIYHEQGRVYGLVRVGQQFIAAHVTHPRHKEAMLKLLDGLQATSRNKEVTAICRQFLSRYPDVAECGQVESQLAGALDQLEDRARAAEAYDAVWKRQGPTPDGRRAGARALVLYNALNNKGSFTSAATLADAMFQKLPTGELASEVGMESFNQWRKINEWAKSNAIGLKMVAKGMPLDKQVLYYLHYYMGENYAQLGQRANAVDSFQKARALNDNRDLLWRLCLEMYSAEAKPADLEAKINEYTQKYPQRADRHTLRTYLAAAWLRAGDKPKALALFAELLPLDAVSNNLASKYVQQNGPEPEKFAQSEQVLRDAIATNPKQAAYLRYVLALEVYRDRIKDLNKARQTIRELAFESPSNDGYSVGSFQWLLYNEASEAEFQADVNRLLQVRKDFIPWAQYRNILLGWHQEAARNKDNKELKARAAWVKAQLEQADKDPLVQAWLPTESGNANQQAAARAKLLAPDQYGKLNDLQSRTLLSAQAYWVRYQGPRPTAADCIGLYAQLAKRFPKEFEYAQAYVEVTSDYPTPPEAGKDAALHLFTFEPAGNNSDTWRRLVLIADRLKDVALLKQCHQYIEKSQQLFGIDVGNASYIGDILDKYELKAEAVAYWTRAIPVNRHNYESRACAERLLKPLKDAPRTAFLQELLKHPSDFHGTYAMWLADDYLKPKNPPMDTTPKDIAQFEKVLRDSRAAQNERLLRSWGMEEYPPQSWVDGVRANPQADEILKKKVFAVVRDLNIGRPSAAAALALLELPASPEPKPMAKLLTCQNPTTWVGNDANDWDRLMVYGQSAMARKDYSVAATLLTGMLSNIPNVDAGRKQTGRELVGQSYARMGGAGLSIDESSPIAPLLQAAMYLRLGDERLAFDSYTANRKLFDDHRLELPVDLILFVCESHSAAGGDENFDRAEDILRAWLVKNSEAKEVDENTKAAVQLLLAKNYFKSQRYEVARAEFTTVINRYPKSPQATEAEFGIGESFMAQKVYDQAEAVFEKLVNSQDRDTVIRAEFLRGVLANRRGDLDEARDIFRGVLERVPNIELANQALFNLSEVYGAEQRYMDQLELLRTVGRLGRTSQRWHTPGLALSIVVQDSDLGISRGHARIPVRVTTEPGGDEETIYLYSGGAGKGLFRADVETRLGQVAKNDKVLQLTGKDVIKCDYPPEFKAEFKSVPLSDAEIHIASNGKLEVASGKIIDKDKESFSDRLQREAREEEDADKRVSQNRPTNQIKPGNVIYFRVEDPDRDLSDEADKITVKLVAASGDQVQVTLPETGPHTGIFEGTAQTGELPAGALASDTSINHSPLMAIDKDTANTWLSEPDGATPKWLSVDMKDLRTVDHVTITSPNPAHQAPVRGELEGSNDGRFWFKLGTHPPRAPVEPVAGEYGRMTMRIYPGAHAKYTEWAQVVQMTKDSKPQEELPVDELSWTAPDDPDAPKSKKAHSIVWHGKLVQQRAGAARFAVQGVKTALVIDGQLELPLGENNRTVDVWLEPGTHDIAIFAAMTNGFPTVSATLAREDHNAAQVVMASFTRSDFDLTQPMAKPAQLRKPAVVAVENGAWDFQFPSMPLRYVRLMVREYLGEAVAINQFTIRSDAENVQHIPTAADLLSLATNDSLEIAAGDKITATYTDEVSQTNAGRSQLLTQVLTATYFNAEATTIGHDFVRNTNGSITEQRKELIRIDPGERFIVEIRDYDLDQTADVDKLAFKVWVNDGKPLELEAQETLPNSGIFTKEVDTSATDEKDKLTVKPGDRIYCSYMDAQNTFPGHSISREAIVYVIEPTPAQLRIVETRVIRPKAGSAAPPQVMYLPPRIAAADVPASSAAHDTSATDPAKEPAQSTAVPAAPVNTVAFEAPLTVEVIDPDAAKDSRSKVTVELVTTEGAKIEVQCVVANDPSTKGNRAINREVTRKTLEEGRFVGQVILQLGGKNSPDLVPLVAGMPRNLIGGPKMPQEDAGATGEVLVTRVLNLTGKDLIQATYKDSQRPKNSAGELSSQGRLIANATLACTDRDYDRAVESLHVGEKLFLKVTDADLDVSDERDVARVTVESKLGEKEVVELYETLAHSGEFTGSVSLKPTEKPVPGNITAEDRSIETYFGDLLHLEYVDRAASTETGELTLSLDVPVVVGTDGLVAAFSKSFDDETLAVETQFHVAESYFELFKSHKKLGRQDEQRGDLEAGRRVLREVMEDYPNPKYVPRISYLLGQFSQELQQWNEAIESYQLIVRQFPDHALAPDAQYKMAQCHEEAGDFDQALEAYVTLAATYPKSPLIANVMIRISEYFYRAEKYEVAAQVGQKFMERFEAHEWAPRMAFRVGQCYYKDKQYTKAGSAFDNFAKVFPDDGLCADSLFWAGESYRMANSVSNAFRRYNRCRWDFPSSEAAKYARGRLALPEMLNQFEAEANSVDQN